MPADESGSRPDPALPGTPEGPARDTPGAAPAPPKDRHLRRLDRQIAALARAAPRLGRIVRPVRERWGAAIRIPVALLLIMGSLLAILPIFGLWMLPLGLVLLAVDLPLLRPAVAAAIVRLRRRWATPGRWRRPRPGARRTDTDRDPRDG